MTQTQAALPSSLASASPGAVMVPGRSVLHTTSTPTFQMRKPRLQETKELLLNALTGKGVSLGERQPTQDCWAGWESHPALLMETGLGWGHQPGSLPPPVATGQSVTFPRNFRLRTGKHGAVNLDKHFLGNATIYLIKFWRLTPDC